MYYLESLQFNKSALHEFNISCHVGCSFSNLFYVLKIIVNNKFLFARDIEIRMQFLRNEVGRINTYIILRRQQLKIDVSKSAQKINIARGDVWSMAAHLPSASGLLV